MILPDINILVYAHRPESPWHSKAKKIVESWGNSLSPFALCSFVCAGFLRIVTNHRIFQDPTSLDEAVAFVEDLKALENCRIVEPQGRHWMILKKILRENTVTANLVSDAYLAAITIENGCTLLTQDSDFRRFQELDCRWLN